MGPRTTRLLEHVAGPGAWGPEVWERALELGVNTQLYRWAPEARETPDGSAKQWWRAHLAGVLRTRAAVLEVCDALGRGLPYAVLKGEPLSWSMYGDGFMRRTSDVDLLVGWGDAERAAQVLRSLGYEATGVPRPWIDDEWTFVHPGTLQLVELHGALSVPRIPHPETEVLLEGRRWVELGGEQVPVLGEVGQGLSVLYHTHRHFGALKGALDVAGWLDRWGGTVVEEEVEEVLRGLGVFGVLGSARAMLTGEGSAWGRWWHGRARSALRHEEEFRGNDPLSFKTQDTPGWEAIAWHVAGLSVLECKVERPWRLLEPVFWTPSVMARERGVERPGLEDWVRCAARPLKLWRGLGGDEIETSP